MEHKLSPYLKFTFIHRSNGSFYVGATDSTKGHILERFALITSDFWITLAATIHAPGYDLCKDLRNSGSLLTSRLAKYLKHVFVRCCEQDIVQVYVIKKETHAIFNTGLHDSHMNEIYVDFVQADLTYPFKSHAESIKTKHTEPIPRCKFYVTANELVIDSVKLRELDHTEYLDLHNIIEENFSELIHIGIVKNEDSKDGLGKEPKDTDTSLRMAEILTKSFKESIQLCLQDYHLATPTCRYVVGELEDSRSIKRDQKKQRGEFYQRETRFAIPMKFHTDNGLVLAAMILRLYNGDYTGHLLISMDRISLQVRMLSESLATFSHWNHLYKDGKVKFNPNATEFVPFEKRPPQPILIPVQLNWPPSGPGQVAVPVRQVVPLRTIQPMYINYLNQ